MSAWLDFATTCRVGSIRGSMAYAFGDGRLKSLLASHEALLTTLTARLRFRRTPGSDGLLPSPRGEFGIGKREGRGGPHFAGFKPSRSRGLLATTSYQPFRVNPADNAEPANQMMGHQAPGLILFVFVLWDTHSFGDLPLLHPAGGSGFSDAQDEPLLIFEFCFWLCHADRMS